MEDEAEQMLQDMSVRDHPEIPVYFIYIEHTGDRTDDALRLENWEDEEVVDYAERVAEAEEDFSALGVFKDGEETLATWKATDSGIERVD